MRKILIFILLINFSLISYINAQELITLGSQWKYLKGQSAVSASWLTADFDDSSWSIGMAPFCFGDSAKGTQLTDMLNNYSTVYLRKEIDITIADSLIGDMFATYTYDDGFRVWVNGVETFSQNVPADNNYNSVALSAIEPTSGSDTVNGINAGLKNGKNIICVLVYNSSLTSSDLYFDISATLSQKIPKAPEVIFSMPGGYYTSKFNLTLSTLNSSDTIKYTLDYSDPATSKTAIKGKSPLIVSIDPDDTTNRPATPGVVVRASVSKWGYKSGNPETRTYIFLEKIKTQTTPGGDWPAVNSYSSTQLIDYAVDSRVINDSRYKNVFGEAFTQVPTVSLVVENPALFDVSSGIYMNALKHGDLWEKPASLELINESNKEEFAVGIGVRIRGGWSRHNENPKHAFRVFFKDEYGKKKLDYPIFGNEGVKRFDKFDLRCAQNYSWSYYNNTYMTYAQDETCRDIQGLMGHPYTRSKYCQLFLNGMYWGLFEFQERPESNFAESYLGGDKTDYDVIKKADEGGMEATDGTIDKYQQLFDLTNIGFSNDDQYYKVQGLNKYGYIDTTLEALVDMDNLIDYMLNIFYSGNFDSPLSEFSDNNSPNNIYAIKNRNSSREGFKFIVHDAEHTFNYIKGSEENKNDGVNENRVSLEKDGMTAPSIYGFTPQWLHYRLTSNAKYRQRFADRATKYLYNNGIFTASEVEKVFRNRTSQINMAIIGESARWGDSRGGWLCTKDDDWIPAINNTVSKFINLRTPIVIKQLKAALLLPELPFPVIKKSGVEIAANDYTVTSPFNVTISDPTNSCTIYYMLDGSDPRNIDGSVNSAAKTFTAGSSINIPYPLKLKARISNGTDWSALREIVFTNTLNRDKIRFTEIQYYPKTIGNFSQKSLEFIELKNVGDVGVDISGCKLDSAVNFTFPKGTIINPKGFVVVAADITAFESVYLLEPTGRFSDNLSNDGEKILLADENGEPIIDFSFFTLSGSNGTGNTLVPIDPNPSLDPSDYTYWQTSLQLYGSPFADDNNYVKPNNIDVNEIFCNVYPNPVSNFLRIKASGKNLQSITLVDINGRVVYNQSLYQSNYFYKDLDIRNMKLSKGVYFLNIQSTNGRIVDKIIVQ